MNGLIKFSQKNNIKHLSGPREIIKAILQPNALKPFCVLFFYFLIYQWSGTNALTFYAVQIFNKSGVTINSYLITVVLGVVRLLSTIMACVLCRKCGRRPLTMISSIGCGISMIGFSGYLWYYQYWKLNNIEPSFTWMPVLFIFSYTIACTIGFLVIPWVMIGEVYPVQSDGIWVIGQAPMNFGGDWMNNNKKNNNGSSNRKCRSRKRNRNRNQQQQKQPRQQKNLGPVNRDNKSPV
ncbi:hypothetical protein HCN44_002189 [Aphidius gifuensis]|uniref:Uncharacterized protein n=1 Tax=Aphidius gifuensis TaxID=684658 RepID=A0A834XY30_APHGI|nr:hypothetical protein HCN44_002189 [Aphidius gifuensis]